MLVKLALLICVVVFSLMDVVSAEKSSEVKAPGICTPSWAALLLDKSVGENVAKDRDEICSKLRAKTEKKGYFSVKDHKRACSCMCFGLVDEEECSPVKYATNEFNLTAVANLLMDWSGVEDPEVLPEDGLDDWLDALRRSFPLVLSLIPVIIRGLDVQFGYSHCCMMLLFLSIVSLFISMTSTQAVYIVLVTFVSLVDNGRAGVFPEVIGSALTIVCFVGFGLITSPLYQVGFTVVTIIAYIAVAFHERNDAD